MRGRGEWVSSFGAGGFAAIRIALLVHAVAIPGVLDAGGTMGVLDPAPARSLEEEERGRRFPPPHHTPGRHLLLLSCANLRRRPTPHTHRIREHVLVAAWRQQKVPPQPPKLRAE